MATDDRLDRPLDAANPQRLTRVLVAPGLSGEWLAEAEQAVEEVLSIQAERLHAEINARYVQLQAAYARARMSPGWDPEKLGLYFDEEFEFVVASRRLLFNMPASNESVQTLTRLKGYVARLIGQLTAFATYPASSKTAPRRHLATLRARRPLQRTRTRSREVCAAPSRRRATTSARSTSSSDDGPSSGGDPPGDHLRLEHHHRGGRVNQPMRRFLGSCCLSCGRPLIWHGHALICVYRPCERWGRAS